jgi:hypothetical protein
MEHWGILTIEGCDNPIHIWSIVEKDGEDNQKVRNASWTISQMPAPKLEHDHFWAWWVSNTMLENVLERVLWCKRFEMEFWNWTICCLMDYSKEKKHGHVKASRRSQVTLKCCWKWKVLLLTRAKASKRKERWSTINLTMMEATGVSF